MKRRAIMTLLAFCAATIAPVAAFALPSIPSSAFQPSSGCGCHAALIEHWRPSMHAKALTDPLYVYKLEEGEKATGGALGPLCNGCHAPVAVMAGELSSIDRSKVSEVGLEGVTCDFCHQVSGTQGTLVGDTSTAVSGDGVKRAQIKDPKQGDAHRAAYSQFHETAEFCGNCHNVNHPGNGMHLEATYTEWKNGPYAAEGVVCQDCHMTPGPGVIKPNEGKAAASGPTREHVYKMTFAGGNVALGDAAHAEERLKSAAKLELDVPLVAEGGEVVVRTTITNVGAGHYLPTGLTEIRQMWLEVTATDDDGTELLEERREFGSVLKDAKGDYPVELWEAVAFQRDDRIPPRGSTSNEYRFPMASSPVTVKAELCYRSCSEEMADKAGVEVPTTIMASVSKTVYPSEDAVGMTPEEYTTGRKGVGGGTGLAIALVTYGLMGAAIVAMNAQMKKIR